MSILALIVFLLALTAFAIDALAGVISRFDRRPGCAQCGRRQANAGTGKFRRIVPDANGKPVLEVSYEWRVCNRHGALPTPKVVDALDAYCNMVAGGSVRSGGANK